MSTFITQSGDEIFLNLERIDCKDDGSDFTNEGANALKLITSIGKTKPLTSEHLAAVEAIFDEGICISPFTIFGLPLHRGICKAFNEMSEFGCALRLELDATGAFGFLDGVHDKTYAAGVIERTLAIFTVSTVGLSGIHDVPLDFVHAVADFFRTSDGLGWDEEILGVNGLARQCVSNVINSLAKIYNDPSLVDKARKHRRASDKSNRGWHAFRHSADILDQEVMELSREYREDSQTNPKHVQTAVLYIVSWLKEVFPNETVRDVALSPSRPVLFSDFLKNKSGGKANNTTLATVQAARKISESISERLAGSVGGRALFDLVSRSEVNKINNEVAKLPKPSRTRSRPLPEKLIPIMKEILDEGANGWPGKNFRVDVTINGKIQNRYCPVVPSLFRAMLDLPLRMSQFRRLDSGEGDVTHFNGDSMEWEKNYGPLAGHWADKDGRPREGYPTRGYAIEIEDDLKTITGISVNTNKTGEPFSIPWYIPSLLKNLWNLRKWQEKFNPITAPIGPETYLDSPHRYAKKTKAKMPHIFPISRMLPTRYWPMQGRTATAAEIDHAWCYLLLEIEHRWNKQHPGNLVTLVDIHPKAGQPYHPLYNIHGLRVRGLTNLRRGGMPLDLLSKFVAGHASVWMTIYYTEPQPSEIADHIEKASARSGAQREFIDDLKRMEIDEALKRTVSVSKYDARAAIESASQFQFCNVAIGICPYDGSRCHDGGRIIRRDGTASSSKSIYGPVEPRNCVMCRHFLSGPPWLNELADYGTKLCERRQHLAKEENRINAAAAQYEQAQREGTISSAEYENRWEDLGASIQQIKNEQEMVENAIFNVELLCNASVRLLDEDSDGNDGVMLVANNRASVVEYREISEFEQAVRITAAGRIYQILGDERVEQKRDEYLNLMLFNSGVASPQMITRVSPEHRRRAMDQYALFISSRASREEIQGLVEGTLRLQDLGIEEQAKTLIEVALSEPILLPGMNRPLLQLPGERE